MIGAGTLSFMNIGKETPAVHIQHNTKTVNQGDQNEQECNNTW